MTIRMTTECALEINAYPHKVNERHPTSHSEAAVHCLERGGIMPAPGCTRALAETEAEVWRLRRREDFFAETNIRAREGRADCSALPKNYSPHLQRSDVMGMRAQALIYACKNASFTLIRRERGQLWPCGMTPAPGFGFWRSAIPPRIPAIVSFFESRVLNHFLRFAVIPNEV